MLQSSQLVGTWKLRKHSQFTDQVEGLLIYHPNGSMAVVIHGVRMIEGSLREHTVAYAGTFSIEGSCVHHHVLVAERSNRKAERTDRYVTLQGDVLVLSEGTDLSQGFAVEWVRAAGAFS